MLQLRQGQAILDYMARTGGAEPSVKAVRSDVLHHLIVNRDP